MDIEISMTNEIIKNANEAEKKFCEKYIKILKSEFQKINIHFALICAQEFARKIVDWNLISLGNFSAPLTLHKNEYLAGGSVLANIWNNKFLKYHRKRSVEKKRKLKKFGSESFKSFMTNPFISPEKKRNPMKNWASLKSKEIKKKEEKLIALNELKLQKVEINDYDIFFTKLPSFDYSKLNILETMSSISVLSFNEKLANYFEINDTKKLQFVKRVYNNFNNIIGGFDLDPCRFIQVPSFLQNEKDSEKKGEVFTTIGGLYALLTLKQVININCQSKNFYYRIKKYNLFKPLHIYSYSNYMSPICSQKENDYSKEQDSSQISSFSISLHTENFYEKRNGIYDQLGIVYNNMPEKKITKKEINDLNKNLEYLLTGQFEFFYHRNGEIYELDEFISEYKNLKNPQVFFSKTLSNKIPSKKIIKLGLEKIKVFYHRYAELGKHYIIKNSHSQFTGSFNPTSYTPSEIYIHPRKINFIREFPQIMIIYIRLKKKIPKRLIYRILRDYFDDIVLEFLKVSYPCF